MINRHTTWVLDHHDVERSVEVRWCGGSLFHLYVDGHESEVFTLWGRDGQSPSPEDADRFAREHLEDLLESVYSSAG